MLVEKNALTDECKSLIETVLESMDQPNKKRKTGGKQLTIEAAFKMSNNDASNNWTNESSDEDEWYKYVTNCYINILYN